MKKKKMETMSKDCCNSPILKNRCGRGVTVINEEQDPLPNSVVELARGVPETKKVGYMVAG